MNLLNAIKLNISGTVPEKKDELIDLCEKYSPQFDISHDTTGYKLEAGFGNLITFNQRTIYQIWLSGFSSWIAYKTYLPPILLSLLASNPLEIKLLDHPEQTISEKNYTESVNAIEELSKIESIQNYSWPLDIPHPNNFNVNDIQQKAVFDLTVMATAFTFLHEIRHVQIKQENIVLNVHDEELECDLYAIKFITDSVKEYSDTTKNDYNAILSKRSTALAIISHLFLVQTPLTNWKGSDTHPPLNKRIEQLITIINLPKTDNFWLYLSCMLLAQLRLNGLLPDTISFNSYKNLAIKLNSQIRK